MLRLRGVFDGAGRRLAAIDDDELTYAGGWPVGGNEADAEELAYERVDPVLSALVELDPTHTGDESHTITLPTPARGEAGEMAMPHSRTVPAAVLRRRFAVLEAELAAARTDPVSGLPTRVHWARLAENAYPEAAAVLLVDLDGFKTINDTHGHAAGDLVLARTGQRLAVNLPAGSVLGRLGGDEFVAITTRPLTDSRDLDRLVDAVTAPVINPAGPLLRVGDLDRCRRPRQLPSQGLPAVMGAADLAMYQAKQAGGGWATYQPDIHGTPTITTRPLPPTRHHDAA